MSYTTQKLSETNRFFVQYLLHQPEKLEKWEIAQEWRTLGRYGEYEEAREAARSFVMSVSGADWPTPETRIILEHTKTFLCVPNEEG